MKKLLFALVLCNSFLVLAQNKLVFTYDAAGNQVKRALCTSCTAYITSAQNLLKQELTVSWELENNITVSALQVFSSSSQMLGTYPVVSTVTSKTIPLQGYTATVDSVLLICSDGQNRIIKIK
jgi:hypothetical protein